MVQYNTGFIVGKIYFLLYFLLQIYLETFNSLNDVICLINEGKWNWL